MKLPSAEVAESEKRDFSEADVTPSCSRSTSRMRLGIRHVRVRKPMGSIRWSKVTLPFAG